VKISDPEIKSQLLVQAEQKAYRYFKVFDEKVLPAILQGELLAAKNAVEGDLAKAFDEHSEVLKVVSANVSKADEALENEAAALVKRELRSLLITCVIVIFLIFGLAYWGIRKVVWQIRKLTQVADLLSQGNIEAASVLIKRD